MSMAERFDENDSELLREFQPQHNNKEEKIIMTRGELEQLFTKMMLDITSENPIVAAAISRKQQQEEEEN